MYFPGVDICDTKTTAAIADERGEVFQVNSQYFQLF